MSVDLNLLKDLRDATQASFKDCKDALIESNGDMSMAKEILKQKGAAKAEKKAERVTKEGIVKLSYDNGTVIGLKLACETDFVAKNETFHLLANKLIEIIRNSKANFNNIDSLDGLIRESLDNLVKEYIVTIGENMKIIDAFSLNGTAFVYEHPGNKVSSVIFYDGIDPNGVAKEIALQVAAMNPEYLSVDNIPQEIKDSKKQIYMKELEGTNKPDNIKEKIIEGKISKDFSEVVLLEQSYIRDETKKIKDIIPAELKIKSYIRYSII